MIEHTQRVFGGKRGSCLATCIASILDMDLKDVPNFACYGENRVHAIMTWCMQYQLVFHLGIVNGPPQETRCSCGGCHEPVPTFGLVIAGGESPRHERGAPLAHAVVWDALRQRLVWDPHPARTGLVGDPVRFYWFTAEKSEDR